MPGNKAKKKKTSSASTPAASSTATPAASSTSTVSSTVIDWLTKYVSQLFTLNEKEEDVNNPLMRLVEPTSQTPSQKSSSKSNVSTVMETPVEEDSNSTKAATYPTDNGTPRQILDHLRKLMTPNTAVNELFEDDKEAAENAAYFFLHTKENGMGLKCWDPDTVGAEGVYRTQQSNKANVEFDVDEISAAKILLVSCRLLIELYKDENGNEHNKLVKDVYESAKYFLYSNYNVKYVDEIGKLSKYFYEAVLYVEIFETNDLNHEKVKEWLLFDCNDLKYSYNVCHVGKAVRATQLMWMAKMLRKYVLKSKLGQEAIKAASTTSTSRKRKQGE